MTAPNRRRLERGLFIVFEGLDGAGKTTQICLLDQTLRQEGYDVVCLKEPTDGPWGQKIRQSTRDGQRDATPDEELAWFLADRREDVEHNIQPALAQGSIVILDRYYFSTMAYQGALGRDPDAIQRQNEAFAPPPDLLFLLELEPAEGLRRVQQTRSLDGFERLDYLEQVQAIFAEMTFPYLRRVDATAAPEAIHMQLCQEIRAHLAQRHPIDRV